MCGMNIREKLSAPVKQGDPVGRADYYLGETLLSSYPICAGRAGGEADNLALPENVPVQVDERPGNFHKNLSFLLSFSKTLYLIRNILI